MKKATGDMQHDLQYMIFDICVGAALLNLNTLCRQFIGYINIH